MKVRLLLPKSFFFILLFFFIIYLVFIFVFISFIKKDFSNAIYNNSSTSKKFYNSLKYNGDIGCKSLNFYKPKIIFVGDSISYYSLDYFLIKKNLKKNIGSCSLPGMTYHTIADQLNYFKNKNLTPELLVISFTKRLFLDFDEVSKFYFHHKKNLENLSTFNTYSESLKVFLRMYRKNFYYDAAFKKNQENYNILDTYDQNKLNLLIDKIVYSEKIKKSSFDSYSEMKRFYSEKKLTEFKKKNYSKFCRAIKNFKGKVLFIENPVSDFVSNTQNNDNYKRKVVANLERCVNKQNIFTIEKFKNNKIFYVVPDENDNKFEKLFNAYENGIVNDELDKTFDFLHMNSKGSKNFTKFILKNFLLKKNAF